MADETLEELWKIKDGIAQEYGYNLDMLVAHLKTQESSNGRRVVTLRAKKAPGKGQNRKTAPMGSGHAN